MKLKDMVLLVWVIKKWKEKESDNKGISCDINKKKRKYDMEQREREIVR